VNCRAMPQDLAPLLPTGLGKSTSPVKLGGPIHFTGRIGGVEEEARWSWDADIKVHLKQNRISFTTGHVSMNGELTGSVRAWGRVPDLEVSADVKAEHATVSGNGMDVEPFEASISLSGRNPVFDLKGLSARVPHASARLGEKEFGVDDILLQIQQGRVNVAAQALSFLEIRFDSSLLKNVTGSVEAADGKLKFVEIQGKETGLAGLAMGLDLLPSGWNLAGRDSLQVQVRFDANQGVAITSELAFQNLGFQDPGATCAGENLSLKATIKGMRDPASHAVTVDIAMDADGGEVLYDRFYVDLKRYPLSSHCMGTYNIR